MHTNWCVLIEISLEIGMLNFMSMIDCLCNGACSINTYHFHVSGIRVFVDAHDKHGGISRGCGNDDFFGATWKKNKLVKTGHSYALDTILHGKNDCLPFDLFSYLVEKPWH